MPRSQESDFARASFRRMTGRTYENLEATFENLSPEALRDLVRLVHDVEGSIRQTTARAAREPWRRNF